MTQFAAGGRDVVDIAYFARFADVTWSCDLEGSSLEVELTLTLEGTAGPTSKVRTADITFFVALAARRGAVIAKKTFASRIPLPSDRGTGSLVEEIDQRFPLRAGQNGADFEILVGLQLTREQLEYNRTRGIQ